MIEAVVFDMDGVLVDSEPAHHASTNDVLALHGAPALEFADYATYIGMSERAFFTALAERFGLDVPLELLLRERLARSLERLARDPLPPQPGALECLLGLVTADVPLALASSATRTQIDLVLDRLGIRARFSAIVGIDDVEQGKPAPDLFLEAARRLGREPARCLVVEDAVLGVQAAVAAAMPVVAYVPGGESQAHRDAGAAFVLGRLDELRPDRLDGWGLDPA